MAPYEARIASAFKIIALGQEQRISIAGEQGQGVSVFDFTSGSSKPYELDADDVRLLARKGILSFHDSVKKELAPLENRFLKVINSRKQASARSLLAIMADEKKYDRELRDMARHYLVEYLSLDVIDDLISNLRQGDEFIRFQVIKVLSGMYSKYRTPIIQSHDIIELIIEAMADPDKDIRWLAALIFLEIKDARAVEPLRKLSLTDQDSRVQEYAKKALNKQEG